MWYKRMELEVWFDQYQYLIQYDIGESAVKTLQLKDLNMDLSEVYLRYGYHTGAPALRDIIAEQYPGLSVIILWLPMGPVRPILLLFQLW